MESSSGTTAELEGSTLGSKSRDDSRQQSQRPNKRQTSGGFLLDSLHSTNSQSRNRILGSSRQRTDRTHGTDHEKRRHVDDEIIVPKKRTPSHRGTHQQRGSLRTSPLAAVTNVSTSDGQDSSHNDSTTSRHAAHNSYPSNIGLDTDPAQIINLALNLSESRRRSTVGRTSSIPLTGSLRSASNNQVLFSSSGNASRPLAANKAQRHSSLYPQDNRNARNAGFLTPSAFNEPISDLQDVHIACSQATLTRIHKTKQHFELFSKYLELLSYLPPLQHAGSGETSAGCREYNPLQAIRNRKIRLREKNAINVESEGWEDVSKVNDWFESIKTTHEPNNKDPNECLALPPCPKSLNDRLVEEQEPWYQTAIAPLANAQEPNRSNTKTQRPRLDWTISPAELLADACWLESGSNKAKVVDGEGEKLYPDPSKLKFPGESLQTNRPGSVRRNKHPLSRGPATPSSLSKSRHANADVPEHQWSKSYHAQSTSNEGLAIAEGIFARPKWTRSDSSSGDSSSDEVVSRGRSRRKNRRKRIKSEAAMQAEKLHRVLKGHSNSSNRGPSHSTSFSQPSSVKGGEIAGKTHTMMSPSGSVTGKEDRDRQMSISVDEMDSTAPNSPSQGPMFPSITANLSPPSSRSPSPQKRLTRVIESLQERTKSRNPGYTDKGEGSEEGSLGNSQLRARTTADSISKDHGIFKALDPSPLPETQYSQDDISFDDYRRTDSHGSSKLYIGHESKLRGFLKNNRIAEIVGSEVSKVGDLIRRKEGNGHSRHSSYASSIASDDHASEEEGSDGESTPSKRMSLRKASPFSDDEWSMPWRKSSGRAAGKSTLQNLPLSSSISERWGSVDLNSLRQSTGNRVSNVHFVPAHPGLATMAPPSIDSTPYTDRRGSYGFGLRSGAASRDVTTELRPKLEILDSTIPPPGMRLGRPPVTGLTNADTSNKKRPRLSTGSHGWSFSDRSVLTLDDLNTVEKREVLRYQAFLLSSGIKASALVHRFEEPRTTPPLFLVQSLVDKSAPIPRVSRIDEFNYAARNLVETLENRKTELNKSMYMFSKSALLPLEKKMNDLEHLINNSFTPRVRAAAHEAESLSTQLNTSSTLAIKQLSNTLDKGLRKRNRRLRSIRRIGFVLLEWVLVGVMWWVWLIVMIFKVFRGVTMGVVRSIRWILWL